MVTAGLKGIKQAAALTHERCKEIATKAAKPGQN
jgi:hypothetical protein